MAKLTLEENFFSDDRIEYLSKINDEERLLTEGRIIRLYVHCLNELHDTFDRETINMITRWVGDVDFCDNLVKAKLAEDVSANEFRIKGTTDRINDIKRRRDWSRKGGIKAQKNRSKKKTILDEVEEKPKEDVTKKEVKPRSKKSEDYQFIVDHWNDNVAPFLQKPQVTIVNDKRKKLMDRMIRAFPEQRDVWVKILDHAKKVDWILKGLTFKFESYFEKDRFTQFYEETQITESGSKAEFILSQIPEVQPVLDDDELEGRM